MRDTADKLVPTYLIIIMLYIVALHIYVIYRLSREGRIGIFEITIYAIALLIIIIYPITLILKLSEDQSKRDSIASKDQADKTVVLTKALKVPMDKTELDALKALQINRDQALTAITDLVQASKTQQINQARLLLLLQTIHPNMDENERLSELLKLQEQIQTIHNNISRSLTGATTKYDSNITTSISLLKDTKQTA